VSDRPAHDGAGADPLFDLTGRVAVITGGMGQLGSEYACALAARGMRVAVFDLEREPLGEPTRFEALPDGALRAFEVDVTSRASVEQATAQVVEEWGVPHLLVNNAALDAPPDAPPDEVGPFETYPEASFERVMDVNVKGTLLCCQVIGAEMAAAGRGAIVNVSSIYGILSPVQSLYDFRRSAGESFVKPVAYSVSKSAVLNLTRYLATYWAESGVRVNTITLAGVWNDQPPEFVDAYTARLPMGRMAQASEYVGVVVFLASDASSYGTGANLVVDGGWSAW
jgi:NAD(P)-dependent dehydrogenase (short-subunit alcohol dehydrogenase family)